MCFHSILLHIVLLAHKVFIANQVLIDQKFLIAVISPEIARMHNVIFKINQLKVNSLSYFYLGNLPLLHCAQYPTSTYCNIPQIILFKMYSYFIVDMPFPQVKVPRNGRVYIGENGNTVLFIGNQKFALEGSIQAFCINGKLNPLSPPTFQY